MNDSQPAMLRLSQWCYEGIWGIITAYLFVPKEPPTLLGADDQGTKSFRPAEGFLRYLKFNYWIVLLIVDISLIVLWVIILVAAIPVGLVLLPILALIIVVPNIVAYIAIYLRYDSTWYVLSDRSMRIRRGIWIIHETTITYENIQNVTVNQGPIQRLFGISDIRVETAGGGGSAAHGGSMSGHHGILEGVDCPEEVRQLILEKWKQSKSTGLGDEHEPDAQLSSAFHANPQQLVILQQIRDLARALAGN